jgi:hypothetical protein
VSPSDPSTTTTTISHASILRIPRLPSSRHGRRTFQCGVGSSVLRGKKPRLPALRHFASPVNLAARQPAALRSWMPLSVYPKSNIYARQTYPIRPGCNDERIPEALHVQPFRIQHKARSRRGSVPNFTHMMRRGLFRADVPSNAAAFGAHNNNTPLVVRPPRTCKRALVNVYHLWRFLQKKQNVQDMSLQRNAGLKSNNTPTFALGPRPGCPVIPLPPNVHTSHDRFKAACIGRVQEVRIRGLCYTDILGCGEHAKLGSSTNTYKVQMPFDAPNSLLLLQPLHCT